MKVLVLGSGAREHVIAKEMEDSLIKRGIRSKDVQEHVFVYPGNGGTACYHNITLSQLTQLVVESSSSSSINLTTPQLHEAIYTFIKQNGIELVIVGPEDFLAQGISNFLIENGVQVFGPTKEAAQMETSKAFAKRIMMSAGVPTADYREFTRNEYIEAKGFLQKEFVSSLTPNSSSSRGKRWVLKADGLCAGKGVIIPSNCEEAVAALDDYFFDKRFGVAGEKIIIEEFMEGEEVSILAFVDGESVRCLPASQDHKRAFDGDKGPNTGGMGVYTPVPIFKESFYKRVEQEVLLPVVRELKKNGIIYQGILYAGLMIKGDSINVVEFNVRFGDPECQCVLPLFLKTSKYDFLTIIDSCIEGNLKDLPAEEFRAKRTSACCVVIASGGYPGTYQTGFTIDGLSKSKESLGEQVEQAIYHAGTKYIDGKYLTSGGRVLSVCSYGSEDSSLAEVIDECYERVKDIKFTGSFYRTDIGGKGLNR